jgi:anti-sigma factor RsiW
MAAPDDIELMQHHDGELSERASEEVEARLAADPQARAKQESLAQVAEILRSHLELAADNVSDRRFDAMWKEIDAATSTPARAPSPGVWSRITGWLDRYRGHVITGALSAGAVAALALILRTTGGSTADDPTTAQRPFAIDVRPAAMRTAPEIESLETPNGEGTVLNLEDEDGHTTVIWVSREDTVEGI